MLRERIRCALQGENAARVLVDEQELIGQRREALANAGTRPVVCRQMPGREARRHAERGAHVQGERGGFGKRRALLARRIGQLVAPQGAEVQPDAAEHAEGTVEAVAGVALLEQGDDVTLTLVAQRRLDRIAAADHLRAILLREVEILQLGVHLRQRRCGSSDRRLRLSHSWLARALGLRPARPRGRGRAPAAGFRARARRAGTTARPQGVTTMGRLMRIGQASM